MVVYVVFVVICLTAVSASPAPEKVTLKPPQLTHGDGLDIWSRMNNMVKAVRYSPDQENIYYLFTRAHPTIGLPLLLGNINLLAQTDYEPSRRTVVLVHGWLGSVGANLNRVLVPAFLETEDCNVIVVDWGAGARGEYISAVGNTVTSGESAARFVSWLNGVTGASLGSYHLVGHSLGGHQVGIIGRNLGGKVAYITSLDPAFPLWMLNSNRFRSDDGLYTEVIHTNAGEAGFPAPLGHVDFYPNGGNRMPGCDGQSCDHDRCFYYMAEAITRGGFTGTECGSYLAAMMGNCSGDSQLRMCGVEPKMKPKDGSCSVYYFTTNASPPFSIT